MIQLQSPLQNMFYFSFESFVHVFLVKMQDKNRLPNFNFIELVAHLGPVYKGPDKFLHG